MLARVFGTENIPGKHIATNRSTQTIGLGPEKEGGRFHKVPEVEKVHRRL